MLSRGSLDQLNIWRLQLKGAIAAQEHRFESLERRILRTGTVPEKAAPFLASLEKSILVCKKTLGQLERTLRLLIKVIDSHHLQVNDTSLPPPLQSHQPRLVLSWHRTTLTHDPQGRGFRRDS